MNKINWFLLQWYFLIVKSVTVPDVTTVLKKLQYDDIWNITCVLRGENLNSGIAWIPSYLYVAEQGAKIPVSKYVPDFHNEFNCQMKSQELCTSFWENDHWHIESSQNTNLDVVTDNRWEEFEAIYTETGSYFKNIQIFTNSKNKITINFSIRAKNEAHILLCNSGRPLLSKCYWILLGGELTAIKKCLENELDHNFQNGKATCGKYRDFIEVSPYATLSIDLWKHFTIVIDGNNIVLKLMPNDITLLNYTDNEYQNLIKISNLMVRTFTPVYWKFHNYEFIYTTSTMHGQLGPKIKIQDKRLCISFYAVMCLQCTLIINVLNINGNTSTSISKKTVKQLKEFKWQEVKLRKLFPTSLEIILDVERQCDNNCDRQFWAIDNFRICADNEIRVLNIQGSARKSSFQIIDSSFRNLYLQDTNSVARDEVQYSECPTGTIGSTSCTTCSQVFGSDTSFCESSRICNYLSNEESFCRCATGYRGSACDYKCSPTTYGNDCKENCGACEKLSCHFATGICSEESKCISNFTDLQCKTPPYPILSNAPIVTNIGYTDITIQIRNFSYLGLGTPATFKIIYALTNNNSNEGETGLYKFTYPNEIILNNLYSDTSYTIRIVLLTSENKFYDGTFNVVPTIVAKTICSDFLEKDIIVTTTDKSAVLTFRNRPELCPLKYYEIKFYTDTIDEYNNEFHVGSNLIPHTTYTINIRNTKTQAVKHHNFTTKEAVSSAVTSVKVISFNATSVTISWEEPKQPNGRIRHYVLYYKHHKYLGCNDNDIGNENIALKHQSTHITLNGLIPYSEYIISIAAFTVVVGDLSEIRVNTSATDVPDESEIPIRVSVQPSSTEADIALEQANCSFIKGDIEYYISVQCTSEWCFNFTLTFKCSYHDARYGLKLKGLLPYSDYIMDIKVGRLNGSLYTEESSHIFKTCSTEPRPVQFDIYERSEHILRLRIAPPYPPTGELEQYSVWYRENGTDVDKEYITEYFEPVSCKIWIKYHCIDISQNLKARAVYVVIVQARNKNISKFSVGVYQFAKTLQAPSHAPEEPRCSWDNYYNLTLQWNHPNITNGPLTKFIITIAKGSEICYSYNYTISEENTTLIYRYVVLMENKSCYTSQLTVFITSCNQKVGASITLMLFSPPETPALSNTPIVESVSNTTITIVLSAKTIQFPKSFMYIVLSESMSKFEIDNLEDSLNKLENSETLLPSWLIAKYNLSSEVPPKQFTIGSSKSNNSLQNDANSTGIKLNQNTSYTITILMYSEYQDRKRYRVYEIINSTTGSTISSIERGSSTDSSNSALYALILIFLLVLPLLFWIYIRKRKTGKWCSFITNTSNMLITFKARVQRNPDVIPLTETIAPKPERPPKKLSNHLNVNKVNDKIMGNTFSKPIKITDFDKYVKNAIVNGELERQHSLFASGQTKPWEYGVLPQNKFKNRYNNLIAYDHTRVKLEKINGDPYSDYINANYIEGCNSKNAYIATQGPKVTTINDFWRMIWQENVKYIVMLANLIEGGKKKTEQYWPNINETTQFGIISVTYVSTVVSTDYEHRSFLVTSNNIEREIEQFHFTSWPDHGVPIYSQSLVPLFRKLLSIPQGNSPIVIHCSAGVGRTGTAILCDLCLRMSARESVLDVLKYQHKIREQRVNLVDNYEQYKLVHLVLLECLINPNTSITCDENTEINILHLLETDKVEKQFQYIGEMAWQDQAMRPLIEEDQKPEWKQKTRVEDILASGYGHICLSLFPETDEQSYYINAVEVDGFKAPKKFIATQQPLPNTISDFWRMIDEKEVTTIVSLNSINEENNLSCIFWPTSKIGEIQPVPYLLIKFVNEINHEEITIIKIEMHYKNSTEFTKRDIILITLKDWPAVQFVPNSNVSLFKLWEEVEKVSQNEHPIVVTCYDGATACGLFTAFTFVIEKIKLEHQCDVCLAVRTVRHNREQFVQNLDQFKYLYRATIEYLSSFELYAKFFSAINTTNITE